MRLSLALPICAALVLTSFLPAEARAQSGLGSPRPLGAWLDNEFRGMLQTCLGGDVSLEKPRLGGVDRKAPSSFLPAAIYANLRLADNPAIQLTDNGTVTREFGQVYVGSDATSAQASPIPLELTYGNLDDRIFQLGERNTVYTHTCGSALEAILKANVGFTVPPAQFRAALEAQYSNNSSTTISFIDGRFNSPVWTSLTSSTTPQNEAFETSMAVWSWYRQNVDRIGQPNWITASFRGLALYRFAGISQETEVAVTGEASVGFGLASMSAGGGGRVTLDRTGRVSDYQIAISQRNGATDRTRQPLPDIQAVAVRAANNGRAVFQPANSSELTIYDRTPKSLRYLVTGIPAQICLDGWTTNMSSLSPVQSRSLATAGGTGGAPQCELTTTLTPTEVDISSGVNLSFNFVTSIGTGQSTYSLSLPSEPLALTGSLPPFARLDSGNYSLEVRRNPSVGTVTLTWTPVRYILSATQDNAITSARIASAQLRCEGVDANIRITAQSFQPRATNRDQAALTATFQAELLQRDYDRLAPTGLCPLEAQYDFVLESRTAVSRVKSEAFSVAIPEPPAPREVAADGVL